MMQSYYFHVPGRSSLRLRQLTVWVQSQGLLIPKPTYNHCTIPLPRGNVGLVYVIILDGRTLMNEISVPLKGPQGWGVVQ
jgi:hypothetical protein